MIADVEKYNAHSRKRADAFGFADLIAVRGDETAAIQVTSTSNVASRITKIKTEAREAAIRWLKGRDRTIAVIGWRKYAKPVSGRYWRPTIVWLSQKDLEHDGRDGAEAVAEPVL